MTESGKYTFEPDYAIPPGETLHEVMVSMGMKQKELSDRTGLTVQSLNRIFRGQQPITFETANRLEYVTGYPARFWNNLESQYREQLARVHEEEELKSNMDWLAALPVRELQERGVIHTTGDRLNQIRDALRFFGVASAASFHEVWETALVAPRKSTASISGIGPVAAWLRLGELQAAEMSCPPYDRNQFRDNLTEIRKLIKSEPEEFYAGIQRLCRDAGVAFCLVPEFSKAPWSGASRWLTPKKPMIQLSLRGKTEDRFWFSFFHEAAHILNGSKKVISLSDTTGGYQSCPDEKEADEFAAEILIPRRHDETIAMLASKAEIKSIAGSLDVTPGIVAGRFQHLTGKWSFFNDLKRKLDWAQFGIHAADTKNPLNPG